MSFCDEDIDDLKCQDCGELLLGHTCLTRRIVVRIFVFFCSLCLTIRMMRVKVITRMAVRIFVANLNELFLGDLPVLVLVHFLECFEYIDYESDKQNMEDVYVDEKNSKIKFEKPKSHQPDSASTS